MPKSNPKVRRVKEIGFEVGPPPIHEHYDEKTQRAELCGRVVCPYGFVGITPKPPKKTE